MNIGEPKRIIVVEPLELPEPLQQPERRIEEPEREPVHEKAIYSSAAGS